MLAGKANGSRSADRRGFRKAPRAAADDRRARRCAPARQAARRDAAARYFALRLPRRRRTADAGQLGVALARRQRTAARARRRSEEHTTALKSLMRHTYAV